MHRSRLVSAIAVLVALAVVGQGAGASSPPDNTVPGPQYSATIVRDEWGVPHITAGNWASLGFGQGYALAEDRACTVLDQIVKVRGERARWHGAGDDDENIDSDFAYRHLGLWEDAPTRWADQAIRVQQMVRGYVAGFNTELADHGDRGWCAGQPWVGPITTQDLYGVVSDILLLASSRNLIPEIGSAQPPDAAAITTEPAVSSVPADATVPATEPVSFAGSALVQPGPGASNGWALGADRSSTGGGLLLANPHFPWEGELRFWESHLLIPGELNVYGVALTGLPGIQIGFNGAVAWTHTVSAGHRFTLFRYDLDPADPTVYMVDGQPMDMTSTTYTIDVAAVDGTTTPVSRTLYATKHGPVVSVDPLDWTSEQAIAIGDANLQITTVLDQYLAMDTAISMDAFQQAHEDFQGVPWVNTIATSADGRAWMADVSATPNLSADAIAAWEAERAAGGLSGLSGLSGLAYDQAGVILLDGSDSLFDWVDDPAAPAPGLIPYAQAPQLERSDYVFNANDSYWLANTDELLTGYSPLQGAEAVPQSPRTRTNAELLGEADDMWSTENIRAAIFSDRSVLAELLRQPLVDACGTTSMVDVDRTDIDISGACAALAGWDGTYTLNAVGAIVFREWLARFSDVDRTDAGRLFADAFDPADPAGTPSEPVTDRSDWLVELGRVVQELNDVGIPVDAPLGQYQWEIRTGEMIPMHGGTNVDGTANVVDCCAEHTMTTTYADPGVPVGDPSLLRSNSAGGPIGYPINRGASFVMALQFTNQGPQGVAQLTYANPDDPTDPVYDRGVLGFSNSELRTLYFLPQQVTATGIEPVTVSGFDEDF